MSSSYIEVELNHQPVELCKLLKIANLVSGGGEAKIVISEGYVLLNGEVEYQKRKKIYHEDIVEFNGEIVQLIINDESDISLPDEKASQPFSKPKTKKRKENKQESHNKNKSNKASVLAEPEVITPIGPKKRKPIVF